MLLHSMLSCNSAIDLQLLSWLILNDFPFSVSFDSALSRCNNKHKVLGNCDHFVSYGAFHTWALINPQHFTQTAQCIFLALNNHNGPILAKNCSTLTTSIAEVETRKSDCGIIYQGRFDHHSQLPVFIPPTAKEASNSKSGGGWCVMSSCGGQSSTWFISRPAQHSSPTNYFRCQCLLLSTLRAPLLLTLLISTSVFRCPMSLQSPMRKWTVDTNADMFLLDLSTRLTLDVATFVLKLFNGSVVSIADVLIWHPVN